MAIGVQTYDTTTRREDLLGLLRDVSPISGNWLIGNLGTSEAKNTLHEWSVFHVARPTSVTSRAEGFDASISDLTTPTRSQNVTGILAREWQVTETMKAVNTSFGDPVVFQKEVALKRLNADMEFVSLNGTFASGASGVARGMAGIDSVISTNLTARASGTSMSVQELEDILQNSWDQVGSEYVADTLLVTMGIKRKISSLTTNVTNYVNETDRLYKNISVFEASTGVVRIVPHKDVRNTAGSTTVYAIKPDMYKIAFLRQPKHIDLPSNGSYQKGMYETEFTLESLAEKCSVKRTGYAQNG